MNLTQHLLCKLAEEASEIAQIAMKTQQFGMQEQCPGLDATNAQLIHSELNDLAGIVKMLNVRGLGYTPDPVAIAAKADKVRRYLDYSVRLGQVIL
jgi:hypothetical protein